MHCIQNRAVHELQLQGKTTAHTQSQLKMSTCASMIYQSMYAEPVYSLHGEFPYLHLRKPTIALLQPQLPELTNCSKARIHAT
jgi:hypothetical protein